MRAKLIPHPDAPPGAAVTVEVEVTRDRGWLKLVYSLSGATEKIAFPPPAAPRRTDGLWRHTCFEAFLGKRGEEVYEEFNLSPSGEWAAYRFDGYRSGMEELEIAALGAKVCSKPGSFKLTSLIPAPQRSVNLGVSAVIEEKDGRKSYWALTHPGAKPDFHHPDSFACELS